MTQTEQQNAVADFAQFWANKGDEKQHSQKFWIGLLRSVCGCVAPERVIDFEERVKIGATKFIDGYIAETRTIIEQKGAKIDLDAKEKQSDGAELTPFEQAKRYNDNLPLSRKARWIVVSNFREIRIHDMEKAEPEKDFERVMLADLPREYYRLQFLVNKNNENIRREEEISKAAGELVGKLYDAIFPQYIPQTARHSERSEESIDVSVAALPQHDGKLSKSQLRSLNILCVRIVFCLYAEDAGLFATRTAFEDYIKGFNLPNVRKGLIELFKALDTPLSERDEYDEMLKPFPYVNGGLFRDEQIEIPNFTQEIVDVIVNECAVFNWSEISPTIFGAVFESTLNPETRRKGGMHYTSIANIHKVIDPLFMDDLNAEFEKISTKTPANQKSAKLHEFQEKLGHLKFLDPACGSGNFLTETYLSLRRLENKVISILNKGERAFGFDEFIKVHINQFYGIEINDFAVTVAKTALWIAESQMVAETEAILSQSIDFLPLKTAANIVEGNALRMDWATLQPLDEAAMPSDGLFAGFATHTDGSYHEYDYIMGNPPFVGKKEQSKTQKEELVSLFPKTVKGVGNLDYVTGWYAKAIELIRGKKTKCAFVSTNSITQGEQVPTLWKYLSGQGLSVDFAWRTFRWDSESTEKAHVHCVIVGFSCNTADNRLDKGLKPLADSNKLIFNPDGSFITARNINGYLLDADNIFIENRSTPLCDVPKMAFGNMPRDGGGFILSEAEKDELIQKEPLAEKWIHFFPGAEEFINGKKRWCLWLEGANPLEIIKCPTVSKRVESVRQMRLASKAASTRKMAETPTLFAQITQPDGVDFLIVPRVSSENRRYVPMGFLTSDNISSDAVQIVPNATLYHFGVLTSSVHMAWMRAVGGRLESRYRYSKDVVYNNFPWCNPTDAQKTKIEETAQAILDARAKYEGATLADLYGDKAYLFTDLVAAHEANDKAVMSAYGFAKTRGLSPLSEQEIVSELFKMYENLTKAQ